MTDRRLDHRASFTAQTCAARRAAETLQPSSVRLLNDPYARHFVSDPVLRACLMHPLAARAFIGLANSVYGRAAHLFTVLRVRYIDEVAADAIHSGVDQIVLLGAGFDTTTLRGVAGISARVFEVDAPTTQAAKRAVIDRMRLTLHGNQTVWVPCDFERDSLQVTLLANGFDPERRSLIVWIGVIGYLTRHAVETTLRDLASVGASGSQLVFDYINPDAMHRKTRQSAVRRWARARGSSARRGEPFHTKLTPTQANELLAQYGFLCGPHLHAPELLQRYAPARSARPERKARLAITTAQRSS